MTTLSTNHPIFARYYSSLVEAQRDPATLDSNARSLRYTSEWLDARGLTIEKTTQQHWKEFLLNHLLGERSLKRSSAVKTFRPVRAAIREAAALGLIKGDPTTGVTKYLPKEADQRPQTFTNEQLRKIFETSRCGGDYSAPNEAMQERRKLMFYLSAFAGMRLHEIHPLRTAPSTSCSFIDWGERQIVVRGKAAKIRFVPISPVLMTVLERYKHPDPYLPTLGTDRFLLLTERHQHVSYKYLSKEYRTMLDRAGLQHFTQTSHVFRKTLTSNLIRQGIRPEVVDAIFGWAGRDVRSRYYTGVATEDVRQALAMAYADDPIVPEQTNFLLPPKVQVMVDQEDRDLIAMKLELARLENENLKMRQQAASAGIVTT